jgi:hypothetical protein
VVLVVGLIFFLVVSVTVRLLPVALVVAGTVFLAVVVPLVASALVLVFTVVSGALRPLTAGCDAALVAFLSEVLVVLRIPMISKRALYVTCFRERDSSYRYRGRVMVASPTIAARLIYPARPQIVRQFFEIFQNSPRLAGIPGTILGNLREMSGLNAHSKDGS